MTQILHKKKSFSDKLAEEAIDEIMMAGLAFLLVVTGVNYFNMKWSWAKILAGTTTRSEVGEMLSALAQTFPFKYLFAQYDFYGALGIALALTIIGLTLKAFTVKTKGKFIIDIGKNIYIPAIIGFVVIIALQIWTAINVDEYLVANQMARPEFSSGYFIWQTYGQLFLIGASLLVIGAVIKLIGDKNSSKKTLLVGDTMFNGAFILIVYYLLIRIITLDVVMFSSAGQVMKIFIISNQYAGFTITVCIFMFTFGLALKKYGVQVLKHEKREHQIAQFKKQYEGMKGRHQTQRHHPQQKQYPGQLHVDPRQHIRHPAYEDPTHAVHRYLDPEGHYRKPRK